MFMATEQGRHISRMYGSTAGLVANVTRAESVLHAIATIDLVMHVEMQTLTEGRLSESIWVHRAE